MNGLLYDVNLIIYHNKHSGLTPWRATSKTGAGIEYVLFYHPDSFPHISLSPFPVAPHFPSGRRWVMAAW